MFGALSLVCRLFIFANFYINLMNIKRPCQQIKQPTKYIFVVVSLLFGSSVLCTLCTQSLILYLPLARLRTTQFWFSESTDFFGNYTFFKKSFFISIISTTQSFELPNVTISKTLLNYWLSCNCILLNSKIQVFL